MSPYPLTHFCGQGPVLQSHQALAVTAIPDHPSLLGCNTPTHWPVSLHLRAPGALSLAARVPQQLASTRT